MLSGHGVTLKEHRMLSPISPLQLSGFFGGGWFFFFFNFAEYLYSSLPVLAEEERLGSQFVPVRGDC